MLDKKKQRSRESCTWTAIRMNIYAVNRMVPYSSPIVTHVGSNEQWEQYLHTWSDRWHNSVVKWAKFGKKRPLLVVYFEDLKTNYTGEVERMLDFLQISYSKEQLEERLKPGFTLFKRNHSKAFEHYTIEQKATIMRMIARTKKELEDNGIQDVIQIQRYLAVE